eukprot:517535_1
MSAGTSDTKLIRATNARILDYRLVKITLSASRLPTCIELKAAFCIYGAIESVERLGKSNQFIIRYTKSDSGVKAFNQHKNTVIKQGKVSVTSIKYQWNTYCPSLFYNESNNQSVCSKGSKCTLIHQFKHPHEALVPTGAPDNDKLEFERFKLLRYNKYKEYDAVEMIDFNNMEGVVHHTTNKTQTPLSPMSSCSSSSSDAPIHITKRTPQSELDKKKQQIHLLLKQQALLNPNFKLFKDNEKDTKPPEKPSPVIPHQSKRTSPPLVASKATIDDVLSDAQSAKSNRSARSTVYVPKSDSDHAISSSSSSS